MGIIYKKLQLFRKQLGISQAEMAKRLGIGVRTYSRYESGERDIPSSVIEKLVQMGNIDFNWLLNNKGFPSQNNNEYKIEKLSLKASAGSGVMNFEVMSDGFLYVPKWLFKTPQKEDNLKIIEVVGDSMEPTIEDGAFVIIDITQKLISDGIYAILMGEEILIKRLQIKPNGNILIKSDNPKYEDFCYDPKSSDVALRVVGRKVLLMQ